MKDSRFIKDTGKAALIAAAYFLAAKSGLKLASVHASATPVWPPTGIAFAALLVLGLRFWPAIWIGAFLANITTAGSFLTTIGVSTGNALEGVVGVWLVERYCKRQNPFQRPGDFFKFVALAGVVSTLVSATMGVTSLALGGYARWQDYGAIWLTWWLGDLTGDLIVAPLLVLWATEQSITWNPARRLEAALLFLTLVFVGSQLFGGINRFSIDNEPLSFVALPPLVWAASRFGPREAISSVTLFSGMAILGTVRGFGPFVRGTPNESLLLLQAFLGINGVMIMALAANVHERRLAAAAQRSSEDSIAKALREKEAMLSELNHRVKNNLQIISSFMSLQAESSGDPAIRRTLVESRNRVRSMALVHENLYKSPNLSRIDFGEYVNRLTTDILRSFGVQPETIGLNTSIPVTILPMDLAVTCGLIINELISNSLKHAFIDGRRGEIAIDLIERNDRKVSITVRDNGVGLVKGFDVHGTTSLGWQIVTCLVKQLKGTLDVQSENGAAFCFTFTRPSDG